MNWHLSLSELITATGGRSLSEPHQDLSGVGTDTRADLKGQLFIALKGENFDAHDFVPKAVAQGASSVLVHEWREEWKPLLARASFVQVGDTLKGLQDLGRFWRRKHRFTVVGISGSNGKTSTKEFTAALLKNAIPTFASKGSFNNHWGVPLSLLQAGPQQSIVILEMGMNHAGELTTLTGIAEPNIVAVTMVGRAHIGELGSQEAVAAAKEEMYISCPKALHIFNLDNPWTRQMFERSLAAGHTQGRVTFSETKSEADVQFQVVSVTAKGLELKTRIKSETAALTVSVFGRHNVTNLMTASAIAVSLGLKPAQIFKGLGEISEVAWGRNQFVNLNSGASVLFDAYNANPDSMEAMLNNFAEMRVAGRKFLVVGDMLELGELSEPAHFEVGAKAARLQPAAVLYQGNFAAAFEKGLQSESYAGRFSAIREFDELVAKSFATIFQKGDLIAVKGSRGMKLERVLKTWNPIAFAEKS